jgi:hypothetical protein
MEGSDKETNFSFTSGGILFLAREYLMWYCISSLHCSQRCGWWGGKFKDNKHLHSVCSLESKLNSSGAKPLDREGNC